jgi:RNA polymerase sigma-70 factor, ECF subfamily
MDKDGDGDLVLRIASGDRPALATLYDRYAATLLALGQRILGDVSEAEDVVHDLFLEIWRSAGRYHAARGSVRAWIVMRMRSRALDRMRSAPAACGRGDGPGATVTAEAGSHLAPERSRVEQALAALPAEQRTVLELGYYEGLSSTEIAARQGIPVGTVRLRVAAAVAKLRAGLDESGGSHE